jgi:hypothetical protein
MARAAFGWNVGMRYAKSTPRFCNGPQVGRNYNRSIWYGREGIHVEQQVRSQAVPWAYAISSEYM